MHNSGVELYLNNDICYTFYDSHYSFELDTIRVGDYTIVTHFSW